MPSDTALRIELLGDAGFGVKITDGGIIAYLGSRKLSPQELTDAVPEIEGLPMETIGKGVFIPTDKERLPIGAS